MPEAEYARRRVGRVQTPDGRDDGIRDGGRRHVDLRILVGEDGVEGEDLGCRDGRRRRVGLQAGRVSQGHLPASFVHSEVGPLLVDQARVGHPQDDLDPAAAAVVVLAFVTVAVAADNAS